MNKEMAFIGVGFGMGLLALILMGFVFFVLSYALPKSSLPSSKQTSIKYISYLMIPLWFIVIGRLAYNGFFDNWDQLPPRFLLVLVIPALFILYILAFARSTAKVLEHIPPSWLIFGQTMRILVEIMLWGIFAAGLFPEHLTWEGRNHDVLVGLSAPFIGYFLYHKVLLRKVLNPVWNIFGLILLTNIVVMAVLSTPTPFRVFFQEPANTIVTKFPFIYLPAFIVPMAFLMHGLSLKQYLLNRKK